MVFLSKHLLLRGLILSNYFGSGSDWSGRFGSGSGSYWSGHYGSGSATLITSVCRAIAGGCRSLQRGRSASQASGSFSGRPPRGLLRWDNPSCLFQSGGLTLGLVWLDIFSSRSTRGLYKGTVVIASSN